jgi:glutathione-independent formaldehyde dehydrogenase
MSLKFIQQQGIDYILPKINRAVVYSNSGNIEIQNFPAPKFEVELFSGEKRLIPHGVIVKSVATCICGSDLHHTHGRTPPSKEHRLGHELTGEIVVIGSDVEFLKVGDLVSVPFNIACGKCSNCKIGMTSSCLNTNPERPGSGYGYAQMGGYLGAQADYVLVPYADFNCLKIPNKSKAMDKIEDLALLSDAFPTGYHGAYTAGVCTGKTVYIGGAGPVGLAAAASCLHLLGAASVIIGDVNIHRLKHAKKMGCEIIDLTQTDLTIPEKIDRILGEPFVDCSIDCVGFEARGEGGKQHKEQSNQVIYDVISVTKVNGTVSFPGYYPPFDPKGSGVALKLGYSSIKFGVAWNKGLDLVGLGQCPVAKYNLSLMKSILFDRIPISKWLNTCVIPLEEAPAAYKAFDQGVDSVAKKYILDPHGIIRVHQGKFNKGTEFSYSNNNVVKNIKSYKVGGID